MFVFELYHIVVLELYSMFLCLTTNVDVPKAETMAVTIGVFTMALLDSLFAVLSIVHLCRSLLISMGYYLSSFQLAPTRSPPL